jgi:lipid-binding SYLF domain-containing protein
MMKAMFAAGLATLLFVTGIDGAAAQDKKAEQQAKINASAEEVLNTFFEMEGARTLFDKAAGYAIFEVTKAGLGASGAGGNGVAVNKNTGQRTYMRMGSAGVGFTFGLSRYDIVILFENAAKLDAFTKGGWDSAATAQAAAGTSGAQVASSFFDGVAYYQIGRRGLMASADVSGTRFWFADELN